MSEPEPTDDKLTEAEQRIRYVLLTGKFQNPFHRGHDFLLQQGIERVEELNRKKQAAYKKAFARDKHLKKPENVELIIISGPSDMIVNTRKEFEGTGLPFDDRRAFLSAQAGISEDSIDTHDAYSHENRKEFDTYIEQLREVFKRRGTNPKDVEMVVTIKPEDKKEFLSGKHPVEVIQKELGFQIRDVSAKGDFIGLSSTLLRGNTYLQAQHMPWAALVVAHLRERHLPIKPYKPLLEALRTGEKSAEKQHRKTPQQATCDPDILRYNVGSVLSGIYYAQDHGACIVWPKSLRLDDEPNHFREMINKLPQQHYPSISKK